MIGQNIPSVVESRPLEWGWSQGDVALYLAQTADDMPAWGTNVRLRDQMLREFYKTESMLAGTVFGTASRYASFKWVLSGPARQVGIMSRILHQSEHGYGWQMLMMKVVKDMLTQDNAGWMEAVRTEDDYRAPVIQLNHLDSNRCFRTGNWETPVIYRDMMGGEHKLKWYQAYSLSENPDPDERMRGYQECAVSRSLRTARTIRDEAIYESEKVSGRNPTSVYLISGVQQERLMNMLKLDSNQTDQYGNLRYQIPSMICALDPTAKIGMERVDLRSLPDGYDKETQMRWAVIIYASAFGLDPQDIAPLQGGNLGSGQQSQILAQKGRGKGPALFIENMQQLMNFHGIMPRTISFRYEEQDDAENEARTNLQWRRTQMYAMLAKPTKTAGTPGAATAGGAASGDGEPILPARIIRQIMRDNGDLKQEYLDALGEEDLTPIIDQDSDTKAVSQKAWWKLWQ
jgi:hypothetical protein